MANFQIKDFTSGLAVKIRAFLVNTDENVSVHNLVDTANAEVLGTVTALPTANTVLGRLKDLLSLIVLVGRNALYATGTNGFIASPFTLISSTELSGIASGNTVVSANSGTSGKFSQANFGSAKKGLIYFTAAGAFTPTAGGCIAGWWLHSFDGGTTFERTHANNALPRAPDWIIPFEAAALANADVVYASGIVALPADTCKVFIQQLSGASTSANNHTISCAPIAELI